MMQNVLELLTYRLLPHVRQSDFLALVAATAPALHGHAGLLSRDLAAHDGQWTEVVRWTSQAHADAAGAALMADPAVAPLMAAIDHASLTLHFLPLLWHKSG